MANNYQVHIFPSEVEKLNKLAKGQGEKQGELYGMWTNSGCAVIYIVLPKEDNVLSSNQENIKEYLTKKIMLCHIGKWHVNQHESDLTEAAQCDKIIAKNHCTQQSAACCILLAVNIISNDKKHTPYLFFNKGEKNYNVQLIINEEKSNPFRQVLAKFQQAPREPNTPSGVIPPTNPSTDQACEILTRKHREKIKLLANGDTKSTVLAVLDKLKNAVKNPETVMLDTEYSNEVYIKFELQQIECKLRFPTLFPLEPAQLFVMMPRDDPCQVEITLKDKNKLNSQILICKALDTCNKLCYGISTTT